MHYLLKWSRGDQSSSSGLEMLSFFLFSWWERVQGWRRLDWQDRLSPGGEVAKHESPEICKGSFDWSPDQCNIFAGKELPERIKRNDIQESHRSENSYFSQQLGRNSLKGALLWKCPRMNQNKNKSKLPNFEWAMILNGILCCFFLKWSSLSKFVRGHQEESLFTPLPSFLGHSKDLLHVATVISVATVSNGPDVGVPPKIHILEILTSSVMILAGGTFCQVSRSLGIEPHEWG